MTTTHPTPSFESLPTSHSPGRRRILRHLCVSAAPVLLAAGLACPSARAVTAANFDGANTAYVAANDTLNLPAPVVTGTAPKEVDYLYNAGATISPASGYTGPAFGGALWFSTTDGSQAAAANARIRFNYVNGVPTTFPSQIELPGPNTTSPATGVGANFIAFLQPGFAGAAATAPNLTLDGTSSFNLTVSVGNGNSTSVRFAILAVVGNQPARWYLSSTNTGTTLSTNSGGSLSLTGAALLGSTWGAWDPNGGVNGRLADVPAAFTVTGGSFTNITGAGFYTGYTDRSGSHYAYVPEFTTDFAIVAVPEPGTFVLPTLLVALSGVTWLRRRLRARAA